MKSFKLRRPAVAAAIALFAVVLPAYAQAPATTVKPTDVEVTGQHRGYTNHELFVRLDNDKEMTFTVRIPGDTSDQWHDQFQTLSRITVTYHEAPGEKHPIATAIKPAK